MGRELNSKDNFSNNSRSDLLRRLIGVPKDLKIKFPSQDLSSFMQVDESPSFEKADLEG